MTRKCPECGLLNDDNNWTCSGCGTILLNEKILLKQPETIVREYPFTIDFFVRENFQLFAIIGVIGTMIALLPNIGEKVIGPNWLEMDMGFLIIIFAIFIFAGGLLLFVIFLELLKKIWKNRLAETTLKNITILEKTIAVIQRDNQRIILSFILLLMMIGSVYFLFSSIILIPNYSVILLTAYVLLVGLFLFVIYSYSSFFLNHYNTIKSLSTEENGTIKCLCYILLILFVLILAVYFIAIPITNFFVSPSEPHDVEILTDQRVYSPSISTTIGMELYPTNCTNIKSIYPHYKEMGARWEANYGFFVTQDRYTSKTILLGNPTPQSSSTKVYWSYSEKEIPENKSPIQIKLTLYHANWNNWTPYMNTSFNLSWTDQGYAYIDDYDNQSISHWVSQHPFFISN